MHRLLMSSLALQRGAIDVVMPCWAGAELCSDRFGFGASPDLSLALSQTCLNLRVTEEDRPASETSLCTPSWEQGHKQKSCRCFARRQEVIGDFVLLPAIINVKSR